MELLGRRWPSGAAGGEPIMLSPALAQLASASGTWPPELDGTRYNIGVKYGMLIAQLALALHGSDREEILARLVELLADRKGS